MKWGVTKLALMMTVLTMGASASAERVRLVLDYNDLHVKGRTDNKLHLKKKLKSQYPGIRLRKASLIKVKLVAKSKRGHGTAALHVGDQKTYREQIYGNRYDFNDPSPYTFDKIRFSNPSYDSQGKWQIDLRGNIKIRKVIVVVNLRNRDRRRDQELTQRITCSSRGHNYKYCLADGRILSIFLMDQYSPRSRRCVYGTTYGFSGDEVWVADGCRGTFKVILASQGGGNRRRNPNPDPGKGKPRGPKKPRRI